MVYKMTEKPKVFMESLIITLLILMIGFSWGFYFENFRTSKVAESYKNYEIEALDLKLQNYYYQIMDRSSCEEAIEQNFIFADNLYNTGLEIEKAEEANQITEDIIREKRRHALLKTELWLNTILLKEKCDNPFDTVVYLFTHDPKSNAKVSEQKIVSNVLKSVKEEKGNKIVLIPIAGDMNLGAVDLQNRIYKVKYFPTIIINEEIILEGFQTEEDILDHLQDS
jgi:hypothetical protein